MKTCQISVPICSITGEIQHLLITDMKNSQFKTNWVTLRIAMWPDNSNDCQRPHFVTARAKWFQLRAVRQSKSMKCGRILQTCDYVYVYVYTHVGWTNLWLHKDVSATNLGIHTASVSTKVGLLTHSTAWNLGSLRTRGGWRAWDASMGFQGFQSSQFLSLLISHRC